MTKKQKILVRQVKFVKGFMKDLYMDCCHSNIPAYQDANLVLDTIIEIIAAPYNPFEDTKGPELSQALETLLARSQQLDLTSEEE